MAKVFITIEDRPDGQFEIKLTSNPPITDPENATPAQKMGGDLYAVGSGQIEVMPVNWPEPPQDFNAPQPTPNTPRKKVKLRKLLRMPPPITGKMNE